MSELDIQVKHQYSTQLMMQTLKYEKNIRNKHVMLHHDTNLYAELFEVKVNMLFYTFIPRNTTFYADLKRLCETGNCVRK